VSTWSGRNISHALGFLRLLAVAYLIAFVSLWVQVTGLIGEQGIEPVKESMAAIRQQADTAGIGMVALLHRATLCWFDPSDGFLQFQCAMARRCRLCFLPTSRPPSACSCSG